MTDRVTIQRWRHKTVLPPGHWMPVERRVVVPGATAEIAHKLACSSCGETADLGRHIIANDGRVEPSVSCPKCEFSAHVELEDW